MKEMKEMFYIEGRFAPIVSAVMRFFGAPVVDEIPEGSEIMSVTEMKLGTLVTEFIA